MGPIRTVSAVILVLVFFCAMECRASDVTVQTRVPPQVSSDISALGLKYPLQIPPAEDLLSRLRSLRKFSVRTDRRRPNAESPEVSVIRQVIGQRALIAPGEPKCFRSIPTRDEFLDMVRNNPADANQILQRCNIDVRGISPLPQLPVGTRQLPEDTRQRPVGTWPNN